MLQVDTIDQNSVLRFIHMAEQKLHDSALPGAAWSDERDFLSGLDRERYVFQGADGVLLPESDVRSDDPAIKLQTEGLDWGSLSADRPCDSRRAW